MARVAVAATALTAGVTALFAPSASAVQFSNTARITIPELGPGAPPPWPASPYPSAITVSGLTGAITDVNLILNDFDCSDSGPDFAYPEDIDILLVGPTGVNVLVLSDVGGDNDPPALPFTNIDVTLDDQAPNALPADSQLTSGTFRPVDDDVEVDEALPVDTFPSPAPAPSGATALSTFNGTNPNGIWRLYVVDDFAGPNNCTINGGWTLDILTNGATTTSSSTSTSTSTSTPTSTTSTSTSTSTTSTSTSTTSTTKPTSTTSSSTSTSTTSTSTTSTSTSTSTTSTTAPPSACAGRTPTIFAQPGVVTYGTAGNDVIFGTPGDDRIAGLGGNDVIVGFGGNDQLSGGAGDDIICGGDGNDQLAGTDGDDQLFGEAGNDDLTGTAGNDRLVGGPGVDRLSGGDGIDTCIAGGQVGDASAPPPSCDTIS
ncbi:MAG: calcium-binding protein [Acidimicrobiales bacterium]